MRPPLRGCNKVIVVKDREQHVTHPLQQMSCLLEMELLVPLMRRKPKYEAAGGLIDRTTIPIVGPASASRLL